MGIARVTLPNSGMGCGVPHHPADSDVLFRPLNFIPDEIIISRMDIYWRYQYERENRIYT
jgi:hypothetical protein